MLIFRLFLDRILGEASLRGEGGTQTSSGGIILKSIVIAIAAVKEFESLIEITLIKNFIVSIRNYFLFYLPLLYIHPKR